VEVKELVKSTFSTFIVDVCKQTAEWHALKTSVTGIIAILFNIL